MESEEVVAIIDEITELTETAPVNGLNICRQGGMQRLLNLITSHECEKVRKKCASMFSSINSNNKKV